MMMKDKFRLTSILTVLMMVVGVLLPFAELSAQVQTDKTYVFATDTTFAPFEFQDAEGNFVGIDMDLLDAIAKDQGFDYEMRPLGFNAAVQALESGQVDAVIAGMSITDERKQVFDFSDAYFSAGVQFAVLENSEIADLEGLSGNTVAVKTGTSGADTANSLKEEYNFDVTQFEDSVNMYEDLQVGNAQAVIEDYPVMAYAAQTGGIDLRFIGEQMAVSDFGVAVQKGQNAELITMFNDGLNNIRLSGEYDEIVSNYLGEDSGASATTGVISLIQENGTTLLSGLWTTIWISVVSIVIAMILGITLGLLRTSDNRLLEGLAQIYIDIMRGVPMIVMAFFVYFGIPQITGLQFSAVIAGIITLSLNAAAYIAEIVRGGIQAVNTGQSEASRSLGLSRSQTMRHIILPQAFKIMIPSFINQFVITMKDTSILSVIGLVELTQTGRIIIARTYQSGAMWLIVGVMYILIITLLTRLSGNIEKKYIY